MSTLSVDVTVQSSALAAAAESPAVRAGFNVLFSCDDVLLKELAQARVDHTFEKRSAASGPDF